VIIIAQNPAVVEALRLHLVEQVDRFVKSMPRQQLAFSDGLVAVMELLMGIIETIEERNDDKKHTVRDRVIQTIMETLSRPRIVKGK
jgi:hypothetical protein